MDTATAVGDTINLAVTATDPHGNALVGVPTMWGTTDSIVASVDSAGTVVARSAGTATITVTVGTKVAKSQLLVRQRPAEVRIVGDSVLRVPEGERGLAVAFVADARRQRILGLRAKWRSADPAVASVDSTGSVTGTAVGHTVFIAAYDDMVAQLPVDVYPVPASLTLLGGDGQRAPAGRRVPNPIAVQVVSRSGRPIEGVPVRFVLDEVAGIADPQTGASDAQGIVRATWTLGGVPGRHSLTVSRRRDREPHDRDGRSRTGRCQYPPGAGDCDARGSGRWLDRRAGGGSGDRFEWCCAGRRAAVVVGRRRGKHRGDRVSHRFSG